MNTVRLGVNGHFVCRKVWRLSDFFCNTLCTNAPSAATNSSKHTRFAWAVSMAAHRQGKEGTLDPPWKDDVVTHWSNSPPLNLVCSLYA